ncbi:trypsin-like serine protease [Nonomuraea purpurea]|uniref:Trypsin-like serine protease n=1 Tax=Nonomuraea purpurea TaxID=1849276 RepID=A0ABV8GRW2_9ACTN
MAVLTVGAIIAPVSAAETVDDDPASKLSIEKEPFSHLPPGTLDLMKEQEPRKRAANKIQEALVQLVGDVRNPQGSGFAGIHINTEGVQVWWKGKAPSAISAAIESARVDAPVTVTQAPYSRAELHAEADKLKEQMFKDPKGSIHRVEVKGDGSGIVAVTEVTTARSQLQAGYSALTDIRVPLTIKQEPRARTAGRLNDTNPFFAGARIWDGGSAVCTAGWPVQGRTSGYWYLVTASHCGFEGQYWWNSAGSANIGYATSERVNYDLMLIGMPGPEYNKYMWDGGVPGGANTSPEYTKSVAGWSHVTPGEWLCTSGSFSGAVCLWQVRNDFPVGYCGTDLWGTYECYGDMFHADQVNGERGCRGGDSGGPVFSLSGDYSQVFAEGIISGCNLSGDGDYLVFQDFYTAIESLDVVL